MISERISDDIPPQMKISNMVIPILMQFCSFVANWSITVGTQRAYFELKYFKIVKMRDAKYSLKMAAEKWRQIFPFLNALYF